MKIAYLITDLYSMGGAHNITARKMNYLASLGHEVFLITEYQDDKEMFYLLSSSIQHFDLGIDFEQLHSIKSPLKRFLKKAELNRAYTRKLSELLSRLKLDICINVFFTFRAELLPKINDGSYKILELHSIKYASIHPLTGASSNLGTRLFNKFFRIPRYEAIPKKYDQFVCLTKASADEWNELDNISIIPNFCTLKTKEVSTLDEKRVLLLGRFSPEKNVAAILYIWALLEQKHKDWQLDIVGDGVEKAIIESKIKSLGLKQVQVKAPSSSVEQFYLNSSIVALTSQQESFGLVIIEAQTFAIPSIAYNCPCGPKSIISDNKDGFLIEMNDSKSFAQKLDLLMSNTSLRKEMGQNALIASKQYEIEEVMNKWLALFNSAPRREA